MNNKQKKVVCLTLLLASAPAALSSMAPENPGVDLGQEGAPAPRSLSMYRRALARISGAGQATQDRWNTLSPRTRTTTKIVAGAGILGATSFLGHKLYKWWTKPVVRVEQKSWEARFVDFNETVLIPMKNEHASEADQSYEAFLLRSLIDEAAGKARPGLLLENDAFVGILTPKQKVELEEICALAQAETEAERA